MANMHLPLKPGLSIFSEGMRIAVLRVCLGIEQLQYVINVDRECIARGSEASITLSNKDM
jgi:hypothetical protein